MRAIRKITEIYLIIYLVFITGGYHHKFNSDLFIASYLVVGALIAAWGIYFTISDKSIVYPPHAYIYGLVLMTGILSLLQSENFYLSLKEIYFWLFYMILFIGIINLVGYGWSWRSLLNSTLVVGAIFNAFILAEIFYKYIGRSNICSRGIDGANHKAAFITIVLIAGLADLLDQKKTKDRILPMLLVVSSVICLIATGSRGALIAASAGMFVVLTTSLLYRPYKTPIVVSTSALIPALPMTVLFTRPPAVCKSAWSKSITTRFDLWEFSTGLIRKYPLLGSGPNTFGYLAAKVIDNPAATTHPHNIYLRILSERGFIGMIAGIVLLNLLVKTLLVDVDHNGSKAAGLGLLAAYLIHGLADVAWMDPFVMRYLVVMFGLIISSPKIKRETSP